MAFVAVVLIIFASIIFFNESKKKGKVTAEEITIDDYDPTVDIEIIFRIDRIRKIDFERGEEPVFSLKIKVDGESYDIGEWGGLDVRPRWRFIHNVDDEKENVSIEVELYDGEKMCDISPREGNLSVGKALKLIYSIKDGTWHGDDFLHDASGYGHAGGYEDGYYNENDCEIWFDIYQTDADGDRLTYYEEVFIYGTDPMKSDYGKDYDNDGVPIEWEDHWGYDPFTAENHSILDEDEDGIQNIEEYMMSEWYADPFRQDIFVEVDFMKNRFFGTTYFPEYSKEKVISAFSKHNIMLHIDDGLMGGGGEILPYEKFYTQDKLSLYYKKYFLHNGENEWRKGIFRYCVFVHYTFPAKKSIAGYSYWPTNEDIFNCFVIGTKTIRNYRPLPLARETATASLFMHELGHTLGIFWQTYHGCDNATTNYPWLSGWKKYENYKSCMNYRYAWSLIDYSDGSHGEGDFDDWSHIDPAFFEKRFFAEEPIIH
ncbi:hypothetical protein B6U81_02185 [Thermoplasmatales archaeon ex4484_30]|nr:MAG: hypothetical protein B6U81_02185 [Thermoplasmatales archaeon ex4484_30]